MLSTCSLLLRKHFCPTPTFAFLYQAIGKRPLVLCNHGVHSLVAQHHPVLLFFTQHRDISVSALCHCGHDYFVLHSPIFDLCLCHTAVSHRAKQKQNEFSKDHLIIENHCSSSTS